MKAALEIGPLFENQWTGISVVVAALANHAARDSRIDWEFLYGNVALPRRFVERLLLDRNGREARGQLPDLLWELPVLTWDWARGCRCIYPFIKPMRRYFREEAMIVHDFSPILTPQFHSTDTINHFGNRIREDIESTDHFFCVSEATAGDLRAYFGIGEDAVSVIRLGSDLRAEDVSAAQRVAALGGVEPYVVVVGTLEPRKNGRTVLEYLASNPSFLHRYRLVFIGRDGWLEERRRIMGEITDAGVPVDRVLFTGFVSEQEKVALMYNARFCIYPSFFEGFGLPILEAAVLGKLVVCSNTSSMPEVSPESCLFFDPLNPAEFARAMSMAEQRSALLGTSLSLEDIMARASSAGWEKLYEKVSRWVLQ